MARHYGKKKIVTFDIQSPSHIDKARVCWIFGVNGYFDNCHLIDVKVNELFNEAGNILRIGMLKQGDYEAIVDFHRDLCREFENNHIDWLEQMKQDYESRYTQNEGL